MLDRLYAVYINLYTAPILAIHARNIKGSIPPPAIPAFHQCRVKFIDGGSSAPEYKHFYGSKKNGNPTMCAGSTTSKECMKKMMWTGGIDKLQDCKLMQCSSSLDRSIAGV